MYDAAPLPGLEAPGTAESAGRWRCLWGGSLGYVLMCAVLESTIVVQFKNAALCRLQGSGNGWRRDCAAQAPLRSGVGA